MSPKVGEYTIYCKQSETMCIILALSHVSPFL
uniref:Uncharacterized protein n=1 Tax=Rhizophora mucronata TaxID=61149 RepID=A0A2P2NLA1_RHIMU